MTLTCTYCGKKIDTRIDGFCVTTDDDIKCWDCFKNYLDKELLKSKAVKDE
jgi:uncharacterized radical SAM superfamily Fe-S cluster-containing enzyme